MSTETTTPQAPAAAESVAPAAPTDPSGEVPKAPPWGSDENFTPAKAWDLIQNLREQKGGDAKALQAQVDAIQQAQEAQKARLAEALGLAEPPKTEDALAETVRNLQAQFQASQSEANKLRLAAAEGVPPEYHHLLTETDTEKLSAQVKMVAEYARLKAAATGTPEFQPHPGQGQGAGTPTPEALAQAEYEKYYPPAP